MIIENSNIKTWTNFTAGDQYMHFQFKDKFDIESCEKAIAFWSRECDKNLSVKHIHVWDCQNMSGFEMPAKNLWMKNMVRYTDQIEKIILISNNIVIRGAARLMSKFTTHKLEVYKEMDAYSPALV